MTGKPSGPAREPVDHALLHRADIVARHRAADDLFVEFEAGAARHRLDLQHHVAELAMAAGLLLVAAALGDRFADGLLIADRGRLRFDVDAEAVACSRSSATRRCISPCPHSTMSWVCGLWIIVSDGSSSFSRSSAWPSLTSSLRSVAASDIASTGGVGSTLHQRRRRGLAARQRVAGLDRVELAERDRVAGFGRGALGIVRAADRENAGHPPGFAGGGLQRRAVVEMAGEQPHQRQLAAVLQMHGLEHIGQRILLRRTRRDASRSRPRRALHAAAPSSAAARRSRALAEPSSTGQIRPSRNSRARSSNTASRGGWMSSSNCSISASS